MARDDEAQMKNFLVSCFLLVIACGARAAQEEAQAELLKFETLDGREKAAERAVEMSARA